MVMNAVDGILSRLRQSHHCFFGWTIILFFISKTFQNPQLNIAEETSSSPAEATEQQVSDMIEASRSTSTPAETQCEAKSSTSPIDLSTKKTPEPYTTTKDTASTNSQGSKYIHNITTLCMWLSIGMNCHILSPQFPVLVLTQVGDPHLLTWLKTQNMPLAQKVGFGFWHSYFLTYLLCH